MRNNELKTRLANVPKEVLDRFRTPFPFRGKVTLNDEAVYARDKRYFIDEAGSKVDMLFEMLCHTLPVDKITDQVRRYCGLQDFQFVTGEDGCIGIYLTRDIETVKSIMNAGGYFLAYREEVEPDEIPDGVADLKWSYLMFEPKFQPSQDVRNIEYLYHATPSVYEDKIDRVGFEPRSSNATFGFPDRVYFLTDTSSKSQRVNLINQLIMSRKGAKKDKPEYFNYVDLRKWTVYKLRVPRDINFSSDPNLAGALYTTKNVGPEHIISKEHIDVSKEY